jgi:hypothetical protein
MSIDPYAAPKSQITPTHPQRPRPSRWWWLYFAILCALLLAGMWMQWRIGMLSLTMVLPTLLNLWGMLGLVGYITARPIGPRWQWLICLILTSAQLSVVILLLLGNLLAAGWTTEHLAALFALTGPVLMLPLLLALTLYHFDFRHLWTQRASD